MIRQRNKTCVQELSLTVLTLEDSLLLCWTSYGGRNSIQDQLGTKQLGKKEPSIHDTSKAMAFFFKYSRHHTIQAAQYISADMQASQISH